MLETARLNGGSNCFELDFVEREATPESAMKLGIHLHLAGLPLSDTVSILDRLGVDRCRTTVHKPRRLESLKNGSKLWNANRKCFAVKLSKSLSSLSPSIRAGYLGHLAPPRCPRHVAPPAPRFYDSMPSSTPLWHPGTQLRAG